MAKVAAPSHSPRPRHVIGIHTDPTAHGIALFLYYAAFRIFSDLKRRRPTYRWSMLRLRALPELASDVVRPTAKPQPASRRVNQAEAILGHLTLTTC